MYSVKLLVLGANGFLGSAVVEYFSLLGHEVHSVSRSSFRVVTDGVFHHSQYTDLSPVFRNAGPFDGIIHFAAPNQRDCALDPDGSRNTLSQLTQHLLDLCLLQPHPVRLLFASTSHVYSPLTGTINESSATDSQQPYSQSKLESESILASVRTKLDYVIPLIIRLPNIYGVSPLLQISSSNLLIPDLCQQAISNSCLTLKSSGEQYRSFLPLPILMRHLLSFLTHDLDWMIAPIINLPGFSAKVIDVASSIGSLYEKQFGHPCDIIIPPSSSISPTAPTKFSYRSIYSQFRPPTEDEYLSELSSVFRFYFTRHSCPF